MSNSIGASLIDKNDETDSRTKISDIIPLQEVTRSVMKYYPDHVELQTGGYINIKQF